MINHEILEASLKFSDKPNKKDRLGQRWYWFLEPAQAMFLSVSEAFCESKCLKTQVFQVPRY